MNVSARQLLAKEEILLCQKEGITTKRTIAKRLMDKYPGTWKDGNSARTCIRRLLGSERRPVAKHAQGLSDLILESVSHDFENARKRPTIKSKHYIITSALNNTPIFAEFWENIIAYAQHLQAEIYVIAMRYRNPTSVFTDAKEDRWVGEVLPYLTCNRHIVHSTVEIMGDVKIQPTVLNPLAGMEGLSDHHNCIFGHPRIHMKYLPVLKGAKQKIMMTTGSVTLPNYTDSATGKKGHFHHTYGFSIVSIKDDQTASIRYVTARSNGGFIDLHTEVCSGVITDAKPPLAIVLGDIHASKLSCGAIDRMKATIAKFAPKVVVMHDVFDGESINPHEAENAILAHKKMIDGKHILANEINKAVSFIRMISHITEKVVIVNSNHDYFLDRYVIKGDWKRDLVNAITYSELSGIILSGRAPKGLFASIVEEKLPHVLCLDVDESYTIEGIELGNHGHIGANGSKGSSTQYRRLPTKVITGHTHSPLRVDGVCVVGAQELEHGYNKGMSGWGIADVLINSDGKMQHILYFDNEYLF